MDTLILMPSVGSEKNIAPIFTLQNNILHFTDFPKDLAKVFDVNFRTILIVDSNS